MPRIQTLQVQGQPNKEEIIRLQRYQKRNKDKETRILFQKFHLEEHDFSILFASLKNYKMQNISS